MESPVTATPGRPTSAPTAPFLTEQSQFEGRSLRVSPWPCPALRTSGPRKTTPVPRLTLKIALGTTSDHRASAGPRHPAADRPPVATVRLLDFWHFWHRGYVRHTRLAPRPYRSTTTQ